MKTIKQVFDEFLKEQQTRLKPTTYRGYDETIYLFSECLNSYAYMYLDKKDQEIYDKISHQNKDFCDLFGPDKIGYSTISEFLGYFIIRKVSGSKELMKTVGRVMRKFAKWMNENEYMSDEEYEVTALLINQLKVELPMVKELSSLIFDYVQNNSPEDFTKTVDGYFRVTKVESGELWFEDDLGFEKEIGPVLVSRQISSICKKGWLISLNLGKTHKGWQIVESGYVYPD